MRFLNRSIQLTGAAALLLLTACTVGPNYVKPSAPVPPPSMDAFKESAGWKLARPGGETLGEKWWQLFNDPQLNDLEEQVNISNQNVLAAEAQFRQAKALVQSARAGYFPTVTAGASVTRAGTGGSGSSGSAGSAASSRGIAGTTTYALPIDFAWEADVWGRVRRTVEANRSSAQATEADLAGVRLSAQAALAEDYFLLRAQDVQIRLLNDTVASFQKALDLTNNRYQGGVVARSDVLQAETQLKQAQAQAIDLSVQRAQLEHAIALLVGKPASVFSIPTVPFSPVFPNIPTGVPSQLLERRPDIAGAERRMQAANAEIGVAKAAFYPTVGLGASAGFQSTSLSNWLSWPSFLWSVGPTLSQTLFDGGLRRAQTEQAKAAYDAVVANYRQTVLTGFQEVEDNLAALRILESEAAAQNDAVTAARSSLAVTLNQYRAGIVSYINVTVAQNTLLTNERSAVDILGRRLSASVLLIRALGGGWDTSKITYDRPKQAPAPAAAGAAPAAGASPNTGTVVSAGAAKK
ncbi:efflux transporter outer membrane subunit [Geomesophilobacter sediminis]|uniref:Efflux transporter outer membrane subunit n=1 Tax=Geomesophilobacter sediminis TaxID=2798584 RepID=A0A8J7J7M7_9BACT|nr:efflux transporter outer membrane subunit [Geomesophilobacter sediminis]MBJ6725321.1 efflux transporter outer membrane subunit [Geomesophilobacter sediminis]